MKLSLDPEIISRLLIYWPSNAETGLRAYAVSEGPDQPVHWRSLIRPSVSAKRIIVYLQNALTDSNGLQNAYATLRIRRMI